MRESRAREYFLHFVANDLLVDAAVVLEDLKIKNMSKSAKGDAENHGKNVKPKQGLIGKYLSRHGASSIQCCNIKQIGTAQRL